MKKVMCFVMCLICCVFLLTITACGGDTEISAEESTDTADGDTPEGNPDGSDTDGSDADSDSSDSDSPNGTDGSTDGAESGSSSGTGTGESSGTAGSSSSDTGNTGSENTVGDTVIDGQAALSVTVALEDDGEDAAPASFRIMSKTSVIDEVSRVYIEVIIDETVYSTTDLIQDDSDPLVYTGTISIPVDVALDLHAVALSSDALVLFEGLTEGITATDYGSPAIQMYLERQLPTEDIEANSAPAIHAVYVGDKSLAYGESTNVSVDAEDPQDDVLIYSWSMVSAPEGVDTSTLLTNTDQQGATFTAGTVEGLYTVRITVSDEEGAASSADLVLYISETGLDDEPEVDVVLSDFPDCASVSGISSGCIEADKVGTMSISATTPGLKNLSSSFQYKINYEDGSYKTISYGASQLYSMGMAFRWTDTCAGDNFVEVDAEGNQSAVESSTQVTPSFMKTNLDIETCQITLELTNPEGLSVNYQFVLKYSDTQNNSYSQELNCDEYPGNVYPKIRLICPEEMTAVPGTVTLETCDAQGDLFKIYAGGADDSPLWTWYTSSSEKIYYGTLPSYASDEVNDDSYVYLSGLEDHATYSVIPYYTSYSKLTTVQTTEGTDGIFFGLSNSSVPMEDIIEPLAMRVHFKVYDLAGHYSKAYCTFPIADDIDLALPY